jgi:hypothetical protein
MSFTEYPEADIETHRWVARWTRIIAIMAVAGTLVVDLFVFPVSTAEFFIVLVIHVLGIWAAGRMDFQADEWEAELKGDSR